MRWLPIACALLLGAPAAAEVVTCPDGSVWAGSDISRCECCPKCQDGRRVADERQCSRAPAETSAPATPPRDTDAPPWDLTRSSLSSIKWRSSADLRVLGYGVGDKRRALARGEVAEIVAPGLDLRLSASGVVESVVVEPEFAERLPAELRDLLVDFTPAKMRVLFGVEDATDPEDAGSAERLTKSLAAAGVTTFVGRVYTYRRLGILLSMREGGRAALVLTMPARGPSE